jgi:CRP-like cAMP-binding protein
VIPQPIDTVPLFQRLSEEERQLVTQRLKRRQAAPGELIIAEGQPANHLFIITAGWVKLEGGSVDHSVTLANLGAGSLLGEIDMLMGRPYSTSARSAANTQLLTLARADLEDLINECPSIGLKFSASIGVRLAFLEEYLVQQRLRNLELLSALPQDDLRAIAQQLDFRAIPRGEVIIDAGSPGDNAYLIEEGTVRLVTKSSEGESFEDLKEGALFGHTALMTGKAHGATARAITDVTVWVLSHQVYQTIIQDHPAVKLALSRALAESLSQRDQADAVERLRQLQLFADVPTDTLTMLAAHLVLRHFPTDELIYREGTPGDAMYIVDSGEVRLTDSVFSDAMLLERLRPGDAFGEMALLTGRTRAECARAATDTTVWVMYKNDFDDLMVQYPEISVSLSRALSQRLTSRESDFVIRHLRRIHLFSNLATSELKEISKHVRGLRFRPGEIICLAGQPAQTLYLIEKGEVKRIATGPAGEPITIDILDAGDSFGEQEIVQNTLYATTAQTLTEAELWTISKADFIALMENYPALALTVTRVMADRLARVQRAQTPPPGSRPRPGMAVPPRAPAARPPANVPPPPRVQQPPSGARPIRATAVPPKPQTVAKPVAPSAPKPAATPAARQTIAPKQTPKPEQSNKPHLPNVHLPHISKPHLPHIETPHLPHVQLPHVQMPHLPAPHLPTHKSTAAKAQPHAARRDNSFGREFGPWLNKLSVGGKLRLLVLLMFAFWFLIVSIPWMTISTVSSAVGGLQLSSAENTAATNGNKTAETSNGNSNGGRSKVAYALPTNTPVPTRTPQPTFTPRPQPTRVLPTKTPVPAAPAVAAAPAAPVPALPPASIDPRLVPGSGKDLPHVNQFKLIPATVARGQKFWRITSVVFEDISESNNDHTIYVMIKDENGKRTEAKIRAWGESSGDYPAESIPQKSPDDICNCNYGVFMYGDGYSVKVMDQYPSDQASGMIMPMRRHVNYRVTFQLTTMP